MTLVTLFTLIACTGENEDSTPTTDDSGGDTAAAQCEGGVCVLSGTITEDLTLTADQKWLLRGGVFIGDDENETVLTIEPGTTVYGETSTDGMLVIRRGSKIIADGTAEAPIVFTSSKAEGDRARGDWGGVIVNGRAPINSCGEDAEGPCEAFGEGGTGWYGGDVAADDSGVLRYVRVEFAGTLISPDNELNGLGLQGVGSGTTVDFVQVHMNDDDGVEFFGGTVNARHIYVTHVSDDGIDWTDGWTGKLQFGVVVQAPDAGDNGIEADNNAENNDASPRSMPTISHVTIVGSPESSASDLGLLLREGTAGHLSNIVVVGMNEACLSLDHTATFTQAAEGALSIDHSILDCAVSFSSKVDSHAVTVLFEEGEGNELGDAGLDGIVPVAGGKAASGGQSPADPWFEIGTYRGAVDPVADWTVGWTTSAAN